MAEKKVTELKEVTELETLKSFIIQEGKGIEIPLNANEFLMDAIFPDNSSGIETLIKKKAVIYWPTTFLELSNDEKVIKIKNHDLYPHVITLKIGTKRMIQIDRTGD